MKKVLRISKWLGAFAIVLILGQNVVLAQKTNPEIQKAIKAGQLDKALGMISEGLAENPKNQVLYYLRGKIYLQQEAYFEAKTAFNTGINYGARYPWNYIGLGSVLARENNFPEADAKLKKVLNELNKKNETKIKIGVADAYLASEEGKFLDEAEKLLLNITSEEPENYKALISLGDMYYKRKIYELAQMKYLEAVGVNNECLECYLRIGKIKIAEKQYNDGADFIQKSITIDPNFGPAYKVMGDLWYRAGQFEKAKENFKKYVDLTGGDFSATVRYGGVIYLTGDYQESIDVLEPLAKDTTTPAMLRVLAYDYIGLENAAKGREYLDRYFETMKTKKMEKFYIASDFEYEAKLLVLEGKIDDAVKSYEKVMEMEEEREDIYKTISEMYSEQGDDTVAAEYLEKFVMNGKPKFKDWFTLGNMYYKMKNWEKSDTIFAQISQKYQTTHIGNIFRARGKAQQDPDSEEGLAKPYYEKVFDFLMAKGEEIKDREKRDLKEASQYLGFYYYKHGEDCEKAVPYWEKVLEFDPENEGAKGIIEYCNAK